MLPRAKAGGVVSWDKRGATLHEDSCEERSAHPALYHSSFTHFTAPLSACHRHIRPLTGHYRSVSFPPLKRRLKALRARTLTPASCVSFMMNVRLYSLNTRVGGEEVFWGTIELTRLSWQHIFCFRENKKYTIRLKKIAKTKHCSGCSLFFH